WLLATGYWLLATGCWQLAAVLKQESERDLRADRIEEALRRPEPGRVRPRLVVVPGLRGENIEPGEINLHRPPAIKPEVLQVLQVHLRVRWRPARAGRLGILDRLVRRRRELAVERVVPPLPRLARLRDDVRPHRRLPGQVVRPVQLERVRTI